jgi:hypothetical protein
MRELEPIIRYKMDAVESKAYKIALIWEDECRSELPGESYVKLKKNSDPRKSLIFKYCYKMAKELNGIVGDSEIPLYIRAQIQVLKSIKDGDIHALIEPQCLVGDKAWRRWKMWKFKYDKKMRTPLGSDEVSISMSEGKARAEILASLKFIEGMGCKDFDILSSRKDDITRWMKNGDISCFYMILSPWIERIFGREAEFEFDRLYYRASTTPSVEQFFREQFSHEFERNPNQCLKV